MKSSLLRPLEKIPHLNNLPVYDGFFSVAIPVPYQIGTYTLLSDVVLSSRSKVSEDKGTPDVRAKKTRTSCTLGVEAYKGE